MQPRRRIEQSSYCGFVSSDSTLDQEIERRVAFDLDRIVRVRGAQIHLQIETQANPTF